MSYVRPDYALGTRDFGPFFQDTPEPDTLAPGATPDAANAFVASIQLEAAGRRVTMKKRNGSRLVTPAAVVAATACDGLVSFTREGGDSQLIGAWAGAWYLFDEVDAFTAIATATGYTAGRSARGVLFKNQVFLHDGTKQQLYDGSTARAPGFVRPTNAPAMSAAAGPGVSGNYSARYTWYDQAHNHESSPSSDASTTLTLVNQQRTHTKPAGFPPAHVTHWRIYVRREDTFEAYWMRVATVPIANATHTEAVSDRTRVDRLPLEFENDPPSVTFDVAFAWKGFFFGFPSDSSDMHVSKQGDCESYDPRHVFKVSPGDGRGVRWGGVYGTQAVVMKPKKAFLLIGASLPFDIEPIHGSYGSVSAKATIEVGSRLYGWDEAKGPYWTNLNQWQPLADYRIERLLRSINRTTLSMIEATHDETNSLVVWSVATTGSTRRRTLFCYHYGLDAWIPPVTGLEYAALCDYLQNDGARALFCADYWGRVYALFEGTREGVPSLPATTVRGAVTGATTSTLTDSTATFLTAGAGLAGLPIAVRSPAGVWQWRRVLSNTATEITIDTVNDAPWSPEPTPFLWTYIIGGIRWFWWSGWLDGGQPEVKKRGHWFELQQKPSSEDHELEIAARFDDQDGLVVNREFEFAVGLTGAVWGEGTWGASLWATLTNRRRKTRLGRAFFNVQIRLQNYQPDEPIEITGYQIGADALPRARVPSATT